MVDVNFGPEPGPRPHLTDPREAYLHMVRRKRMYGGILGVLFVEFLPSLTETINIAAVSALLGALPAAALALVATRGLARWPRAIPLFRRTMDTLRAIPEIVVALLLIYIPGGGPVPAVIAIALHTGGALGKLF